MMVIFDSKEFKDFASHMADGISVGITTISGLNIMNINLFQIHDLFQGIVFYMGGFFSLTWLAFRAASGYYDFKKSKKEHDDC